MKILTFFLWLLLIASLLWPLVILILLLTHLLSPQDFYLPQSIKSLGFLILILSSWMILVSIVFYCLYRRSLLKPKVPPGLSSIEPGFGDEGQITYPWTEIVTSTAGSMLIKQSLISAEELHNLSSYRILSYGINLADQGLLKEALGLFRLVIERPDSSPLLVQVAQYRLCRLLAQAGGLGERILTNLEDGGEYAIK